MSDLNWEQIAKRVYGFLADKLGGEADLPEHIEVEIKGIADRITRLWRKAEIADTAEKKEAIEADIALLKSTSRLILAQHGYKRAVGWLEDFAKVGSIIVSSVLV